MTGGADRWKAGGWKRLDGTPFDLIWLWEEALATLERLGGRGVSVAFWYITQVDAVASRLAEDVFEGRLSGVKPVNPFPAYISCWRL